jgi:hypothetical protein
VREVFSSPGSLEWILGVALVFILAVVIVRMMRSRKPDPKMQLILAMMKDFPSEQSEDIVGERAEDPDPRHEQGPLGPGGFSHIA